MSWNSPITGCTENTTACCDTVLCAPCQMGRQCEAVEGNSYTTNAKYCMCGWMAAPCVVYMIRSKVVEKYSIDEGCIGQCFSSFVCTLCSLCQTGRELEYRNVAPGGTVCVGPGQENMGGSDSGSESDSDASNDSNGKRKHRRRRKHGKGRGRGHGKGGNAPH
jgi:Cys-rich protein (TIGR01571 family)